MIMQPNFPCSLFELPRQLLQEGMFDAYNQWIFGSAQNLAAYQNWITTHSSDYNEFTRFQKGRMFKVACGTILRSLKFFTHLLTDHVFVIL